MNKRQLHHKLVMLRHSPKLLFLGLAILFSLIAVFALRANNQHMLELREAVFVADKEDGDIEGALRDLREHVHGHMNTNLSAGENAIKPPIQLKYEYERLVKKEEQKLGGGNTNLYTEAQNYCEPLHPAGSLRGGRVECIQSYVDSRGVSSGIIQPIDESLYKFDFVSPQWSFDLAGWSIIFACLSLITCVLLFAAEYGIKYFLSK